MTTLPRLVEPDWHTAHRTAHEVARPLGTEVLPLGDAAGRIAAVDVTARMSLPSDTTSAMDGWAVGSAQGPWRLVDSALAGHPMQDSLTPATAAVIATGGVVPEGAFGVLRREYGAVEDGWVRAAPPDGVTPEPVAGGHVRPAGEEAAAGEVLIRSGDMLTPVRVGLAAMAAVDSVAVFRRPRAALLGLGDEIDHAGIPSTGRVRDAFGPQLPAYCGLLGVDAGPVRNVPDTLDDLVAALETADAPIVVTTGGTAAGPADFLHRAVDQVGGQMVIDMIAMRPGHPMLMAALPGGRFLVGLPGNPLSAMVGMLTLFRPLARGLAGLPPWPLGRITTAEHVKAPATEHRLVPYRRSGGTAAATPWLGSGMLRGLAAADGIMIVPPGGVAPGTEIDDLGLPW